MMRNHSIFLLTLEEFLLDAQRHNVLV